MECKVILLSINVSINGYSNIFWIKYRIKTRNNIMYCTVRPNWLQQVTIGRVTWSSTQSISLWSDSKQRNYLFSNKNFQVWRSTTKWLTVEEKWFVPKQHTSPWSRTETFWKRERLATNYHESGFIVMVHLLRLWLLCRQADHKHHHQGEEGQHGGEVQVVDVLQHQWPVVLLEARWVWVNQVHHHADDTHRQADGEAPECTLGESRRTQGDFTRLASNKARFYVSLLLFSENLQWKCSCFHIWLTLQRGCSAITLQCKIQMEDSQTHTDRHTRPLHPKMMVPSTRSTPSH